MKTMTAHDDPIGVDEIIDKFNLTHILDPQKDSFVPLAHEMESIQDLDKKHFVAKLMEHDFGSNWLIYVLSRKRQDPEDDYILLGRNNRQLESMFDHEF